MYYEHFGLTQAPFRITPNTDVFFTGGNRGAILDALIYAVTHGEGIVKVTGEVGSGKTMLCTMLQTRLPHNVESVYLANPSVAPEEVLHAIAFELQLGVERSADRLTVMHALQEYLLKRHAEGKRVVVFIEESQSMPIGTLEEIRLLSNLETRSDKLLQIVLFGQPEFDETLRQQNIRQLRDRIAHSFKLEPLNEAEVSEYLAFRMKAAGYRGPAIFSARLVRQIARASSGLTRRINLIADKALLAAFADNTHTIGRRHIDAALKDVEFTVPAAPGFTMPAYAWPTAAMVVGLVGGASIYAVMNPSAPGATATAAPMAATPTPSPPLAGNQVVAQAARQPEAQKVALVAAKPDAAQVPVARPAPLPAASPPEPPSADWVAMRAAATEQWAERHAGDGYSIQIMGGSDETLLKEHLNVLAKSIEMQNIFVYRVEAKGKPWLNVLYGVYADREAAQRALNTLPAPLKAYRPILRNVQGVRTEIRRQRAS